MDDSSIFPVGKNNKQRRFRILIMIFNIFFLDVIWWMDANKQINKSSFISVYHEFITINLYLSKIIYYKQYH